MNTATPDDEMQYRCQLRTIAIVNGLKRQPLSTDKIVDIVASLISALSQREIREVISLLERAL